MVLWKKESNRAHALYIDLLPRENLDTNDIMVLEMVKIGSGKADFMSKRLRVAGNQFFQDKKWLEAMENYNRSLRYASSDNISLAYANRSICFFKMGKYEECFVDIGLAKKANYPQRLTSKLDAREAECLKFIHKRTHVDFSKATLSFVPDQVFACMANVLQIQGNEESSNQIVAKVDIPVDEVILVEEAFTFDALSNAQISCNTCAHVAKNFIPCPNCSDAMFCNAQCLNSNKLHKITCVASYQRMVGVRNLIESLLKAVNAFPNIVELMKFVKNGLANRDFRTLEGLSGAQLKYGSFLKLPWIPRAVDRSKIQRMYNFLLDIPMMKHQFSTLRNQRFLMHLIWQHFLIIEANARQRDVEHTSGHIRYLGIVSSLFNHASDYNAAIEIHGSVISCYTIRPIKKGERLYIRN